MKNEYGFTNDISELERVRAFRDAAVEDGWTIQPTYRSHESVDSASTLFKNGYQLMILTRTKTQGPKWKYEAHISGWAPDGLHIETPETYSWAAIVKAAQHCDNCKTLVEKTFRYSFAGRCCEKCLPKMKAEHERPGWDN